GYRTLGTHRGHQSGVSAHSVARRPTRNWVSGAGGTQMTDNRADTMTMRSGRDASTTERRPDPTRPLPRPNELLTVRKGLVVHSCLLPRHAALRRDPCHRSERRRRSYRRAESRAARRAGSSLLSTGLHHV